jgi:hypothetical protein
MKQIIRISRQLLFGSLLLTMTACGTVGLPINGTVIDVDKTPIAGAMVVAFWIGSITAIVDSQSTCYHVEVTVSDEDGHYRIPGWVGGFEFGLTRNYVSLTAYKPGYIEARNRQKKRELIMIPFTGTREERFSYLKDMASTRCSSNEHKQLIPYNKAIYMEGVDLQVTRADSEVVKSLKYYLDELEVGSDRAYKIRHGK